MTKQDAQRKYLAACPKSLEMISRIINWDAKKGLIDNMLMGGFKSTNAAVQFSRKFELKFVKIKMGKPSK